MEHLDFETITLLNQLSEIEDAIFEYSEFGNTEPMRILVESPEYETILLKRFPVSTKNEIIEAICLPEYSADRARTLYPTDKIVFCCIRRSPTRSDPCSHILYAYGGSISCMVNDISFTISEGQTCIFNGVPHSFHAQEKSIIISCIMSKDYLKEILLERLSGNSLFSTFFARSLYSKSSSSDYMIINTQESDRIKHLLSAATYEYMERSLCADEVINSYVILFLTELLRIHIHASNKTEFKELKNNNLSEIIQYIQDNAADISLASTARHFHFHPNYLSTVIKKIAGQNFTDLVHEAKLKKACILLRHSTKAVRDISNEVGFQNVSYFYRLFYNRFHCSPAQYRKNLIDSSFQSIN